MGGEELKWRQLANHQLMSQQGPHFRQHSKVIPIIKAQISGKFVNIGISDVATASVYFKKTRQKKLMKIIIIIMNKSRETMVFHGLQKLTSAMT